jgi:antitoxin component YwqK of YwqJK toxin-antitoxin module
LTSGGASKALSAEQGKQLNSSINSKVDKVVGKSLISDSEITRLASVTNYDDTDLVAELNKKANTDNVYSKTDIDGKLVVATTSKNGLMSSSDKTKLNGIDLSNYVSLSTYNSKVSELESTISELTARLEALESK